MEPKLSLVLDGVMAKSASCNAPESPRAPPSHDDGTSTPTPARRRGVKLPEKEFQYRQSPLTELLEVPHFRTIHHIFIASLILLMLQAVIIDLVETGSVDLGLERLLWALGESQRTWTLIFSLHFSSIFMLYPGFYYWAHARQAGRETGAAAVYDKMALTAVSIFMTLFTLIPAVILWSNPLPFGSAIVATMEQGRLLMKMYAFVRSNVPRALEFVRKEEVGRNAKGAIWEDNNGARLGSIMESLDTASTAAVLRPRNVGRGIGSRQQIPDRFITAALKRTESWLSTDNDSDAPCPCFTKYLYFLFAPTLVYRDQYPKTSKIRWNHVCWNFSQVVACAFYASFILGRSLSANFATFGLPGHERSLIELLQAVFSLMLPATLTLMLVFFMVLHTWQNAFAEMLYFGDRLFYRDWWNCSSFAVYYKTWNVLVHDWLYTYIYKDATEQGLGDKFKALPTILVFFISSIFHEYILATSFHFFFPAVLVLFGGFGFIFTFVGDRKKNSALGNILMWVALMSGTGIIIAAYSMEHYANINCPKEISDARSVLIPRTFACGAIKLF